MDANRVEKKTGARKSGRVVVVRTAKEAWNIPGLGLSSEFRRRCLDSSRYIPFRERFPRGRLIGQPKSGSHGQGAGVYGDANPQAKTATRTNSRAVVRVTILSHRARATSRKQQVIGSYGRPRYSGLHALRPSRGQSSPLLLRTARRRSYSEAVRMDCRQGGGARFGFCAQPLLDLHLVLTATVNCCGASLTEPRHHGLFAEREVAQHIGCRGEFIHEKVFSRGGKKLAAVRFEWRPCRERHATLESAAGQPGPCERLLSSHSRSALRISR